MMENRKIASLTPILGFGRKVKEVSSDNNPTVTTYYLRSSVLGGAIIEELNASGQKQVGYVYYPGGRVLATQSYAVVWKHTTAAGTGQYQITGPAAYGRTEFDPLGADIALYAPPVPDTNGGQGDIGGVHFAGIMDARWSDMFNLTSGCTIDGVATSCSLVMGALNLGSGEQCPNNECSRYNPNLNNDKLSSRRIYCWW